MTLLAADPQSVGNPPMFKGRCGGREDHMGTSIEYRVRPVTRYIVTRYEDNGHTGRVSEHGEYGNAHLAYEVGYALCKAEHERLGFPPGDPRIQYPDAESQYMHAEPQIVDPPSQFAAAMQKTSA